MTTINLARDLFGKLDKQEKQDLRLSQIEHSAELEEIIESFIKFHHGRSGSVDQGYDLACQNTKTYSSKPIEQS